MPYILVLITREVSSTCFIEPLINFTNFITSHFPAKAAAAKIILVFCNFSLFSWKFGKNGNLTHLFPTLWQRYVDEEKQQWFSEKSKPKSQWFLTKFSLHYYFPNILKFFLGQREVWIFKICCNEKLGEKILEKISDKLVLTWKWRMIVQMSPRVSLGFPSTISSPRILTSLISL